MDGASLSEATSKRSECSGFVYEIRVELLLVESGGDGVSRVEAERLSAIA